MGDKLHKVCLIEDEPYIAEALRYLFEAEGWDTYVINDGQIAVDQVTKIMPDMLVLDYMLPNKSGIQIATELRAHSKTSSLPMLMLTAKGQEKDRQQAKISGIEFFMTKPFSNEDLLDTVKSVLANKERSM